MSTEHEAIDAPETAGEELLEFAILKMFDWLADIICGHCHEECDGCPGFGILLHMENQIGHEMIEFGRKLFDEWAASQD